MEPEAAAPDVVEAMCTLIRKRASKFTVDFEWGRIVNWAFQERQIDLPQVGDPAPLPETLTKAQTAILRSLCSNAELWDPSFGNASLAFKRVQLPYDRQVLCALAGVPEVAAQSGRRRPWWRFW